MKWIAVVALMILMGSPIQLVAQSNTPGNVAGDWFGKLKVPNGQLRIVFHITADADGALTATLDSPDQNAMGIPVGETTYADGKVTLSLKALQARYEGVLSDDGQMMTGTWSQGGASLPLEVSRTDQYVKPNRPQEPTPPFPYEEEDVEFENKDAQIKLAGTLTMPSSAGPHPAVILISGSGPQDRDESLMGHKPFLVLADHLTRRGIAVLRYDDRGTAKSTGTFSTATTRDLADDAQAAVNFLKTRTEIATDKIGLIGHSEGGIIAPMLGAETDNVAFIVMLAGPGLPGDEILNLQSKLIAEAGGMNDTMVENMLHVNSKLYKEAAEAPADEAADRLRATIAALKEELGSASASAIGLTDDRDEAMIEQLTSPWFRFFLSYDPLPTLQNLQIPVLSVIGKKDLQVPAEENTKAIEEALKAGGNSHYEAVILPNLNHLFQHATTGAPSEYGAIEETFATEALELVSAWILEQAGSAKCVTCSKIEYQI